MSESLFGVARCVMNIYVCRYVFNVFRGARPYKFSPIILYIYIYIYIWSERERERKREREREREREGGGLAPH